MKIFKNTIKDFLDPKLDTWENPDIFSTYLRWFHVEDFSDTPLHDKEVRIVDI